MTPSLRLDRLFTIYAAAPLLKIRKAHKPFLPILMYHSISNDSEKRRHPYHWVNTSPTKFKEQMHFLAQQNFKLVTLEEAVPIFRSNMSQDSKIIALTFDDGYQDFLTEAFPVLKEFGFRATVFLPTSFIGTKSILFNDKPCLTWDDVLSLRYNGIRFGSHTVTHRKLVDLSPKEVISELQISKNTMETVLGEKIESFCYPYALPEAHKPYLNFVKNNLIALGYTMGVSTRIGCSTRDDDIYFLRRLPVNSADDLPFLSAKLMAGYDWLSDLQFIWKHLRLLKKR